MFDKAWKVVVAVLAVLLVAGLVWHLTRDKEREMTPLMKQLATKVAVDLREQLPRERSLNKLLVIVVGRGNRDEERQFHDQLIQAVVESDKYSVVTWDQVIRTLDKGWITKFVKDSGLMPDQEPTTIQQAVASFKYVELANMVIDGVLRIEVTQFTEGPNQDGLGAHISLKGEIYDHKAKTVVKEFGPLGDSIESAWDLRYLQHAMSQQSVFWRFPLWLVVACGLPWGGIALVRAVLKRRSNGANIGVLVGFTVIDVALGWILLVSFGLGAGSIVGLLFVAGMMGYYNYDALDYIERRLL